MKKYKTPELNILFIAQIGDIITYSDNGRLAEIGVEGEDGLDY